MNDLAHIRVGKTPCATRILGLCAPAEFKDWRPGNRDSETPRGATPKGPGRGERGVSISFRRNYYG